MAREPEPKRARREGGGSGGEGKTKRVIALGPAEVVEKLLSGDVIRQEGRKRVHARQLRAARAEAAAVWPAARALALSALFLDGSDLAALSSAGRVGRAATSALALPGTPPHQLNAEASLVLRRLAHIARSFDVLSSSGSFKVLCSHTQRQAYLEAMGGVAKRMWDWPSGAVLLMPAPAQAFVDVYWSRHLDEDATTPLVPLGPAILAHLDETKTKPTPPMRVAEWVTAWQRVAEPAVLSKARRDSGMKRSKGLLRCLRLLHTPWLRAYMFDSVMVAFSDARLVPGPQLWVHGKTPKKKALTKILVEDMEV